MSIDIDKAQRALDAAIAINRRWLLSGPEAQRPRRQTGSRRCLTSSVLHDLGRIAGHLVRAAVQKKIRDGE